MQQAFKYLLPAIIMCFHCSVAAQSLLDDIELQRIQPRQARKFIENLLSPNMHQFSDIHPSSGSGTDLSAYRKSEKTFTLKGQRQEIWQGYLTTNPSKAWNSRKISFGLLIQKSPEHIFYDHDSIRGVQTGQIYFLTLRLLPRILAIPVAFEIIRVDTAEKIIESSYIEGNKSIGVQQISFEEMAGRYTKIIHKSYYKSDSRFRDHILYPFFHKQMIVDFHRNMRRILKLKKA